MGVQSDAMTTGAESISRQQVEDFLFEEAALLDEWRLDEWFELFTPDCGYYVPSTDVPAGDHRTDLFLIADDHDRLKSRVSQLAGQFAHAERPRSRTRRHISNVRIRGVCGDTLRVTCNFIVHRIRLEVTEAFVGRYEHTLVHRDGTLKIVERRAILDLDALRPHGRISILL